MGGDRPRLVVHAVPTVAKPLAKVNVFEPDRVKLLIEPAKILPDFAAKHQKRAGGLLDLGRFVMVKTVATVVPVRWVMGPEAVDEQSGQDFVDLLLDDPSVRVIGVSRSPERSAAFLRYKLRRDLSAYRYVQCDMNSDMPALRTPGA